ncbi:MAG TPA: carboxypeptidase regulatory-like domain-containing protein [Bacteroidota bacterium]|nr:carboxypeptidase regulatory-like domain-containing protein [Bacteroidota bacterium]
MSHRMRFAGATAGRSAPGAGFRLFSRHSAARYFLAVCTCGMLALDAGCNKNNATGPVTGAGSVITVTGKVLGQNAQAVAGVPVSIKGIPSTNTDASGNFSFTGVTTPYDISVINATQNSALIYKGLTRTDPVLVFPGTVTGTKYGGSINGTVTGGTFPSPGPRDITRVVWCSPEITQSATAGTNGSFGFAPSWYGPSTTTGGIYALQFTTDAAGFPVAGGYKGYGTLTGLALANGAALSNQKDSLLPVTSTQFAAAITLPGGYTLVGKALFLQVTSTAAIQLVSDTSKNLNPSYYTPLVTGGTVALGIQITGTSGSQSITWKNGNAAGASGVAAAPIVPPELSLPLDAATNVDTNVTFSWTAMTGAIHVVQFIATNHANPTFYIITAGTSATIPNLKSLGMGIPASAAYTWNVFGFGPLAGTDAAAGSVAWLTGSLTPGGSSQTYYGNTPTRGFTTAP